MPPYTPPNLSDRLGPEDLPIGWPWRFFLFSLLVAITAAIVYGGLAFGYKPFLNVQIKEQEAAIEQLSQVVPKKEQESFLAFYSQLVNLQNILTNHAAISKTFPFLQLNTNKQVFYTAIDLRVPERRLGLEGFASNYGIFSQQLQAFSVAPEVETLIINDSNALEGRVKFRLSLTLKPSLLK